MLHNNKNHGEHGKDVLPFTINGKEYEWEKQYIILEEIRKLGDIPRDHEVFLAIKRPWKDEQIMEDIPVDLARPEAEHFISKRHGSDHLVTIHINNVEKKISRGKHSVAEIKKIGDVPPAHELEELTDGKLDPLDDNATVLIKGCEQFFSHVRDGSSS
jgi:Multiubiquitin